MKWKIKVMFETTSRKMMGTYAANIAISRSKIMAMGSWASLFSDKPTSISLTGYRWFQSPRVPGCALNSSRLELAQSVFGVTP